MTIFAQEEVLYSCLLYIKVNKKARQLFTILSRYAHNMYRLCHRGQPGLFAHQCDLARTGQNRAN